MNQYSDLLIQHQDLYNLIESKQIKLFSKFPAKEEFDNDFIDWLSPQYYEAFVSLFNTFKHSSVKSMLIKLVSTPLYCNKETEEKIIEHLSNYCFGCIIQSKNINEVLVGKKRDFNPIYSAGGLLVLDHLNVAIFTNIDHPKLKELESLSIDLSLLICEKLQKRSAEDLAYPYFEHFINQFIKLNLSEEQREAYGKFKKVNERKDSISESKSVLGVIFKYIFMFRRFI